MKKTLSITFLFIAWGISYSTGKSVNLSPDSTLTDYDGNIYQTVQIGTQTWMKENLKSIHYSDGVLIPNVASYNNSDSLASVYGRLYTWDAAMKNSTTQKAQGVCPGGWHVPSNAEWSALESFLGGALVAGGKMKDTVSGYWKAPNKGATNSSGFSALPAGEYDAFYTPNIFQLLSEFAVFWTSTQTSTLLARERYLAFDSSACLSFNWYKVMKYSIRCIQDAPPSAIEEETKEPTDINLLQNYPNPFNPATVISYQLPVMSNVSLKVFDLIGNEVATLVNEEQPAGYHSVTFEAGKLASGVYMYQLTAGNFCVTKKLILTK
ncbi:MAG: FISUMP domain-containing protein [Ignavibacteriaceae bacterium]